MKTKRIPIFILLAALISLAASIACSAASRLPFAATLTPTNTSTSTPTSTPTPTFTPTLTPSPTALPDFESAVLHLDDLPAGFKPVPDSSSSSSEGISYFAFINENSFQVISGASLLVIDRNSRSNFDIMLDNPDVMMNIIAAGIGLDKNDNGLRFKGMKDIPGMDEFGDASNGLSANTSMKGIEVNTDFFIMRTGSVGVFVVSIYSGHHPTITIQNIAEILTSRLSSVVY